MTCSWVYFGNKDKFLFQMFLENQLSVAQCVSRSCLLELGVVMTSRKKQLPSDYFFFCLVETCFGDIWVINTNGSTLIGRKNAQLRKKNFQDFFFLLLSTKMHTVGVLSKCNNCSKYMPLHFKSQNTKILENNLIFPKCLRDHTTCSS